MKNCPRCSSNTERYSKNIKHTYKGHVLYLNQPESYCDLCKESFLSYEDIKATKIDIANFHREVDNLLSTDELKRIRKKTQLSAEDAAILFGAGIRAFHKYETAEETQSKSLDILLRLIDLDKITLEDIKKVSFF